MSSVKLLNFGTVFIDVIKISVLGPSLSVSVLVYGAMDRKTLLNRFPLAPEAAVPPLSAHPTDGGHSESAATQQGDRCMRACGDAMLPLVGTPPTLHPWCYSCPTHGLLVKVMHPLAKYV